MSGAIQLDVVAPVALAVGLWRNDGCDVPRFEALEDSVPGKVGFVCEESLGFGVQVQQQMIGPLKIVPLPSTEMEADRVAQRVTEGVYLSTQTPSGESDGFFFFELPIAPAEC